jgi:multiple sugar transport system permease protein
MTLESTGTPGTAGVPAPRSAGVWYSKRIRGAVTRWGAFAIAILGAFIILVPVIWMVSTSLKTLGQTMRFPPNWIPNPIVWQNYPTALTFLPFGTFTKNTLIYTFWAVVGETFTSSLVAFAFARLRARGSNVLFMLVLATMMVPNQVTMIPQYILFANLKWIDSLRPLIVPALFGSPYLIFLLRQFFRTLPRDMDDAARIDGCSWFGTFWRIIVPMSAPALTTVAILSFMWHWNDFMGPLIYINSTEKMTISVGLSRFTAQYGATPWNLLMAASLVTVLPCVLIFFFLQRYFIQGIVVSGVKG